MTVITVLKPTDYDLNGTGLTLQPGEYDAEPLKAGYFAGMRPIVGYILKSRDAGERSPEVFPVLVEQLEDWIKDGQVQPFEVG